MMYIEYRKTIYVDGKGGMVEKGRYLSWLILHVKLPRLRDAQIADKTLFLGVSVRVFLEDIRI